MKIILPLFIGLLTMPILVSPATVYAGECYSYPTYELTGTATIKSGVNVRNKPCTTGTNVLGVAATGAQVKLHAENDGWYEIETSSGLRGWIWQDFLLNISATKGSQLDNDALFNTPTVTKTDESLPTPKKQEEPIVKKPTTPVVISAKLSERLKGYILLQVQSVGEAWYVNPEDGKRYYMKDGEVAYEMMRAFGLGITDLDLNRISILNSADDAKHKQSICTTNTFAAKLSGKILLQVQQHGEAWYVDPKTCYRIYMKDGAVAYSIMRQLSLGITDTDLNQISSKEFIPLKQSSNTSSLSSQETSTPTTSVQMEIPSTATIPEGIDLNELNQYWLTKINTLRAQAGLRQLVIDQRWINTATEWANYMGENDITSHDRADGKSMHQWIDDKNLEFTKRFSENGWKINYFTENISWGQGEGTMAGAESVLDNTLQFYLAEAASNGPHYRTIYHQDWNSVGLGIYFKKIGDNQYKMSVAFHYGSLVLQ